MPTDQVMTFFGFISDSQLMDMSGPFFPPPPTWNFPKKIFETLPRKDDMQNNKVFSGLSTDVWNKVLKALIFLQIFFRKFGHWAGVKNMCSKLSY